MTIINYRKTIISILANPLDNLIVFIDEHQDQSMNSLKGKIVSETKYMMHVVTDSGKQISIPKRGGKYEIPSGNLNIAVDGDLLVGTAKSRSKKKYRKW